MIIKKTMIKKPALTFLFIILCGAACFAQKIDKDTYNNLVDYCNCVYAKAHIQQYYGDKNKNMVKITSILDTCTVFDHLNYNDLRELIKGTKYNDIAKAYKEDTSRIFDNTKSDKYLINSMFIKDDPTKIMIVSKINKFLKADIEDFLNSKSAPLQTAPDTVKTGQEVEKLTTVDTLPSAPETTSAPEAFTVDKRTAPFDPVSFLIKLLWGLIIIIILALLAYKSKELIGKFISWIPFKKQEDETAIKSEEQESTEPKSQKKKTIKIDEQVCTAVFNWMLKDEDNFAVFSEYIMRNEQLCSLWIKKALLYPKIREMVKKEIPPKEIVRTVPDKTTQ